MESLTVEVLIVTIVKTVAQFCLERERPNIPGVRSLITSSIYIAAQIINVSIFICITKWVWSQGRGQLNWGVVYGCGYGP